LKNPQAILIAGCVLVAAHLCISVQIAAAMIHCFNVTATVPEASQRQ
jgi:hypothetical protein